MPLPSGIRLRDSCDACAASKVRCSKDKPTCTRCLERGTSCQYVVTQRTGRKARHPRTSSSSSTRPALTAPPSPGSVAGHTGVSMFPLADPEPISGLGDASLDGFLASLPMSPSSAYSTSVTDSSLQQSLSQPNSTPDHKFGHQSVRSSASNQAYAALPLWDDSLSVFNDDADSDNVQVTLNEMALSLQASQPSQLNESTKPKDPTQSRCLKVALRLMGGLSFSEPPSQGGQARPLQALIDTNKDIMETVGSIMQLPCSDDGYFLIVICLIVSKVVGEYAAAARDPRGHESDEQSLSGSSATSTSYPPSSTTTDVGRIPNEALKRKEVDPRVAQRLLNELYRVQELVDQLGSKMQLCAKRKCVYGAEPLSLDGEKSIPAPPFSATVLSQLETELRRRLSNLSLELIDGLRLYWR